MNADQAKELLSSATPGPWAYQHGWGIQYSQDGAVGLLIWPERGANATPIDLDLMAAAPDIAALAVAQAAEIERLRGALRSVLDEAWDGQTVYAVDAGTLAKACGVLQESEMLKFSTRPHAEKEQ